MKWFQLPDIKTDERRAKALRVLEAALDAVEPGEAVRRAVRRENDVLHVGERRYDLRQYRRIFVIGAGKAGASMAGAIEDLLGDRLTAGLLNVKSGYTAPTRHVKLIEAGHPVPDQAGLAGAQAIVELLEDTRADDLVICLISGGGSALLTLPVLGVSLQDLQQLTDLLLRSGAPIQDLNAVRKHLSLVKGGQLARLAQPATVIALILSDVVGSPLDVIASGPTVPDPTTFDDAHNVLVRYGVWDRAPASIRHHLEQGRSGNVPDTPKAGDSAFDRVHNLIVADNAVAARAACEEARRLGFQTLLLSTFVEGEAREVARVLTALGKEVLASGQPVPRPACLVLGGETTVTVRGRGRGGRNQELALAAALAIEGIDGVLVASLATDGTDGPTDAAGGLVDGTTVERGREVGVSALERLDDNDAYTFLSATGDLLVTGPTNTNVNDLMAVFVFA